ncbi:uncharacterized protein [Watersipora subatra]|uniref:uncharacterized protein isoform X1 n=1 Tax=Watersipora subatra TaxID=2589382 RepID=UPI00355C376D
MRTNFYIANHENHYIAERYSSPKFCYYRWWPPVLSWLTEVIHHPEAPLKLVYFQTDAHTVTGSCKIFFTEVLPRMVASFLSWLTRVIHHPETPLNLSYLQADAHTVTRSSKTFSTGALSRMMVSCFIMAGESNTSSRGTSKAFLLLDRCSHSNRIMQDILAGEMAILAPSQELIILEKDILYRSFVKGDGLMFYYG